MLAATYLGKNDIVVGNVPDPEMGPGEMLIKVDSCTVCGVDLRTWKHGDKKIAPPRILGHEFCGRVVASNAPDSSIVVGDRIVMYIVIACGTCRFCQGGRANLCTCRTTMSYQHDGAFAEFVKIPAQAMQQRQVYKVPDHVPSHHAAICEPLACVLNAHNRLNVGFLDTVAVIGSGPIGMMHAMAARARGAKRVYVCDTAPDRLAQAEKFAIDGTFLVTDDAHLKGIEQATDGEGPSVVIVACGVAQAQADALVMAGRGGRVEFFGGLPKTNPYATLDTNQIHYKELLISGSYSEKRSDFEAAMNLVFSGRFPCDNLVTTRLPLSRMTEAFPLMEQGKALKVSIEP